MWVHHSLISWWNVELQFKAGRFNGDKLKYSCMTDRPVINSFNTFVEINLTMNPIPKDSTKTEAIIRAAIQIFARDGLEKGKIADIAIQAGIGKGTVYEYFSSKDEIFHAIVDTLFGDLKVAFDKINSMDLSPTEKLRTFMRMNTEMVFEMGDAVLIVTEIWAQGARAITRGEHQSAQLPDVYIEMKQLVINILKAGVEAHEFREMNYDGVATVCLAFIDGFVFQFMLNNDRDAFDRALQEGIQSFMKGLEA